MKGTSIWDLHLVNNLKMEIKNNQHLIIKIMDDVSGTVAHGDKLLQLTWDKMLHGCVMKFVLGVNALVLHRRCQVRLLSHPQWFKTIPANSSILKLIHFSLPKLGQLPSCLKHIQ